MLTVVDPNSLRTRVNELVGKRRPLSEQFEKNPGDTYLALELKVIDDQIADYHQQIQIDRKNRK